MGVFAAGCVVGLVLAYTNFVGFLSGIITGIFIQTSGPDLGNATMVVIVNAMSHASSMINPVASSPLEKCTGSDTPSSSGILIAPLSDEDMNVRNGT